MKDMDFYTAIVWPINMVVLGIASVGVFVEKSKWKNILRQADLHLPRNAQLHQKRRGAGNKAG